MAFEKGDLDRFDKHLLGSFIFHVIKKTGRYKHFTRLIKREG